MGSDFGLLANFSPPKTTKNAQNLTFVSLKNIKMAIFGTHGISKIDFT